MVIDEDGFRFNVGIILVNQKNRLFWAKRYGQNAWQFPQGGIQQNESIEEALFRELNEEIGLLAEDVEVLGSTDDWLRYYLPKWCIRHSVKPPCIGQKQKWFMLRLVTDDSHVNLQHGEPPEFDRWRWVSYWYPLKEVVSFKRKVYRQALNELAPLVFSDMNKG